VEGSEGAAGASERQVSFSAADDEEQQSLHGFSFIVCTAVTLPMKQILQKYKEAATAANFLDPHQACRVSQLTCWATPLQLLV
jgi:hypothetical protein